jgi:Flp pilus assembly protein TadB
METRFSLLISMILFAGFMIQSGSVSAVVRPSGDLWQEGAEKPEVAGESLEDVQKRERKEAKLEKRLGKFEKKLEKRGITKEGAVTEVWDDGKFRLGAILLLAALALGIVALIISLGGFINFIAGVLALAGVVLIIWSLVEYYG